MFYYHYANKEFFCIPFGGSILLSGETKEAKEKEPRRTQSAYYIQYRSKHFLENISPRATKR